MTSALAALRRQRPDVVKHLQGSDDVIFSPQDDGGLTRSERAAAALRVTTLLRDPVLSEHYRARLATLDPDGTLARTVEGGARITEVRWDAILAHVDSVTRGPAAPSARRLAPLAAGRSSHVVVCSRSSSPMRPPVYVPWMAHAQGRRMKPMRSFTRRRTDRRPWLAPLDLNAGTEAQLVALKVTPSNCAVGLFAGSGA